MRARLGLSPSQDILPTVLSFPPDKRAKAMAIIEEMEEEGVRLMQVGGMGDGGGGNAANAGRRDGRWRRRGCG